MAVQRWEPFSDLMSLRQAMDKLFEESVVRPRDWILGWGEAARVPLDVYETDTEVVVKASLAGVKPEDIDISITGDTLTIKGETKAETEVKRESYYRQERRYGAFTRSVSLPSNLKIADAQASFEHGVLTLTIPKAEEARPQTIKVKTGS